MVGTSFVPGVKQDFLDLPEKNNSLALESFRDGRLNLIVATSVLEEVSILHSHLYNKDFRGCMFQERLQPPCGLLFALLALSCSLVSLTADSQYCRALTSRLVIWWSAWTSQPI